LISFMNYDNVIFMKPSIMIAAPVAKGI